MNEPRADRLAARLAPGLPAAVAERLLASPRLSARTLALARAVAGRAEAALAALPPAEAALARAGAEVLERAAVLAGAAWHAGRIRGLLRAADVAALEAELGPDARRAALAHGDLCFPGAEGEPLAEAVRTDGAALLIAWREALPDEVAEALRLFWPLEEPPIPEGDDPRAAAGRKVIAGIAPLALGHGA
ncbi:hypothetical protein VQH23_04835 [Pararoseomonas sp. SCSIO 73927]|uniref:hypothetical protein n=1 Tax=Pararoseomonas sp. SCSIO 73927 TaxID=3114537 RepID=UPI0030D58008